MQLFTSRLISAFFLAVLALPVQAQSVSRGPYLQLQTDSSITLRWRTDTATDSVVRYGTDSASLTMLVSQSESRTEHTVTITGLAPQTRYYYSVGNSAGPFPYNDTYHFYTAPVIGTPSPTRIWVIGDSGTAVTHPGQPEAVREAFKTYAGSSPADFMLMLGDNAYPDGTDQQYQDAVFDVYPELLRQIPVWPTLGNHDGHSANSADQSGPYYDIFDLPFDAQVGGWASGTEAYYSFDYGDIHFISLDSYESPRGIGGSQMTWLEGDLAFNDKPWVIAFWHHPPYSKGSHNSDTSSTETQMRENFLPLLEAWGVDLVLSGHSHSYERSMLIDGHYGVSTTLDTGTMVLNAGDGRESGLGVYEKPDIVAAEHEGTVYAVAGSSGKVTNAALDHPAMYIGLAELGSMVLDVTGNRLDAVFIDENGTVRDEFTLMKTPDIQPPMILDVHSEDGTHVMVEFTERVDALTAGDHSNYSIAGLTVSNADVQAGQKQVRLTTSAMTPGANYVLSVSNVMDESGNSIVANSQYDYQFIQQVTVSFQDGLAPTTSYDGTFDTYIREATATTNYGSASTLQVDGDEPSSTGNDMNILLGWDVSEIPATAIVDSASIHLNTLNPGGPYSCYALLRGWTEAEATWNLAASGSAWGTAGAEAVSDRDSLPLCTVNVGSTVPLTVILNADGLALVQGWIDGSAPNHGLVIADSVSTNGADFDASESSSAMDRPRLEVTYTVPVAPPNQPPVASFTFSCTDLSCNFIDASTDSDGSVTAWAWDFGDGGTSGAQNPNHSFPADGTYAVTLIATDDQGAMDVFSEDVTVSETPAFVDVVADADLPASGSVGGTFVDTQADGGNSQSIMERESGGKKQNRYSYLQHGWRFSVPVNAMATVHANAWSGGSSDDDFRFSWSGDNSVYTPMFTVSDTALSHTESFILPAGTSGTVYIRVEDTDQTPGNNSLDKVFVDHLYIRAEAPSGEPPAAPSNLSATTGGSDTINLFWLDNANNETGFEVERSSDGSNFSVAGNAAADATSFVDSGLSGGTTYWYRVRAFNGQYSAWSNTDNATTDEGLAITLGLSGSKSKGRHIVDLSWNGTTGANVDIFRDGVLYVNVADTGAYTDETGNKGGRTYDYRVCEAGTANCSAVVSITF